MLAEEIKEIINENKSFIYAKEMLPIHYCSEHREEVVLIEMIG